MERQPTERITILFERAQQRAAEYRLAFAREYRSDFSALEIELGNIYSSMEWCRAREKWQLFAQFTKVLNEFWVKRSYWAAGLAYNYSLLQSGTLEGDDEKAEVLGHMAFFKHERGNYTDARFLYEKQLEHLRQTARADAISWALKQLVILATSQGDDTATQKYLEEQMVLAQEQYSVKDQVDILRELATLHYRRNDLHRANLLCQQALEFAQGISYVPGLVDILRLQASIRHAQREYQDAQELYERALYIALNMGDQIRGGEIRQELTTLVDSMLKLAILRRKSGDLAGAGLLCQRALKVAQSIGYQAGIVDTLRQQASIHYEQGTPESARRIYRAALDAALEMGDQIRADEVREKLTMLEIVMGRYIFISYNHHDRDFAERLARDLSNAGFAVWWAEWEIKVGDSIIEKVNQGIDRSAYLAAVLSPHSVRSNWVKRELGSALMKQLSDERDITVLPLLIADCDIPGLLRPIKRADFRKDYETGLQEVLDALLNTGEDLIAP